MAEVELDSRIRHYAAAMKDLVYATGHFVQGHDHAKKVLGAHPSFCVWFDGFAAAGDKRSEPGPTVKTLKYAVDVQSVLFTDDSDGQYTHWALVQSCINALEGQRVGNCLRCRLSGGDMEIARAEQSTKTLWRTILTFEIDHPGRL